MNADEELDIEGLDDEELDRVCLETNRKNSMSRLKRKPTICIGEIKDADQLLARVFDYTGLFVLMQIVGFLVQRLKLQVLIEQSNIKALNFIVKMYLTDQPGTGT